MQPYNSGRMLIHGHRQNKSREFALACCKGVWVLVLQISPCVLHVCFASKDVVYFSRYILSVYIPVFPCRFVGVFACRQASIQGIYPCMHVCVCVHV